jgi:hypothetical protein
MGTIVGPYFVGPYEVKCIPSILYVECGLCYWTHIILLNEFWQNKWYIVFNLSLKSDSIEALNFHFHWLLMTKIMQNSISFVH